MEVNGKGWGTELEMYPEQVWILNAMVFLLLVKNILLNFPKRNRKRSQKNSCYSSMTTQVQSQHPCKKVEEVPCAYNPQEVEMGLWASLASQPSIMAERQHPVRLCLKKSE